MKQQLTVPSIGDPVRLGITRPSDGMNELIKHAKNSYHGSTIQTRNWIIRRPYESLVKTRTQKIKTRWYYRFRGKNKL